MKFAILRVCASCEWVFKAVDKDPTCPKCSFGSYGAYWVYGQRAYRYFNTQERWLAGKIRNYEYKLRQENNLL